MLAGGGLESGEADAETEGSGCEKGGRGGGK